MIHGDMADPSSVRRFQHSKHEQNAARQHEQREQPEQQPRECSMSKEANLSDWFGEPPYTSSPCDRFSRPAMPDFDISPIRPTGKINGYLSLPLSSPRASTPIYTVPSKILKSRTATRMTAKTKIPRLVEGDVFINSHLKMRPVHSTRAELKDNSDKFFDKAFMASRQPGLALGKIDKAKGSGDGLHSLHSENLSHAPTNTRLVTADVFIQSYNKKDGSRLPRPRTLAQLSFSKINIQQKVLQNQRQKQRSADQQGQGDIHEPAKGVFLSERTKIEHFSPLHNDSSLLHSMNTGTCAEPSELLKTYSPDPLAESPAVTDALCDLGVQYYRRSSPLRATEVDNLS